MLFPAFLWTALYPQPQTQPASVLTAKPTARTRAWEVEPGKHGAPPPLRCQPMGTRNPESSVQSPPSSSVALPLPSTFPLAPPSLTERKVPTDRSGSAAIGGRSVTGRPNQSVRKTEPRVVIGQRGGCVLRPRSLPPPPVLRRRGRWGRAQVAGSAARGPGVGGKYWGGGC